MPKGTLVRLSLARWWSPNQGRDKRCYLQLSGFYIAEAQNNFPVVARPDDIAVNLNPNAPAVAEEKTEVFNNYIDSKTFIGIDFGTSTSVISIAYYDKSQRCICSTPIEISQKLADGAAYKADIIPTMLAWHKKTLLVGEGAKKIRLLKTKNRNIWSAFKMDLGKKNDYLYDNSELCGDGLQILNARDATSLFFAYLLRQIHTYVEANHLSPDIEFSISVPASFEPDQRNDLLLALENNDYKFNEQAFIDEPNAAFLSYISNPATQKNLYLPEAHHTNILVFDYGAGTCDISILEVGLDDDKFISKNIAISKFDYIGGKEVDRLIAHDILLPQLLLQNDLTIFHFTARETKIVLQILESYAELLKIEACKSISLKEQRIDYDSHEEVFTLSNQIEIKTSKGVFHIDQPKLSFSEFAKIMQIFTSESSKAQTRTGSDEKFYSVFRPILTALNKAKLSSEDIDYLLFIGGSAQNPFIQKALKEYFSQSQALVPQDLQTHVSAGAAINSLLYNGFRQQMMPPISNEPIYLIVNRNDNAEPLLLFAQGLELPTAEKTITNLCTTTKTTRIELPICISAKENVVFNIVIEGREFTKNTAIALTVQLDANRTLHCCAVADGLITNAKIENSLLSIEEATNPSAALERYEYEHSKALASNGGKETADNLYQLYKKYNECGEYQKAADAAEELHNNFGKMSISLNNIGILYNQARNKNKAQHYFNRAGEEDSDECAYLNLAHTYQYSDPKKYVEYLNQALKINSDFSLAKYNLLLHKIETKNDRNAAKELKKIYKTWQDQYHHNRFPYNIFWLINCARHFEDFDFANQLEQEVSNTSQQDKNAYDENNLATLKEDNNV